MRVVYKGVFDSVDIPSIDFVATRDVPIEVPDSVGASLCEQSSWEKEKTGGKSGKNEEMV